MERVSIPSAVPSWVFLTQRQVAAGDHLPRPVGAGPSFPSPPGRPRRASVKKYCLTFPAASAPWADTMVDNNLARLLGSDDLGRIALALCQASLQPRSYET